MGKRGKKEREEGRSSKLLNWTAIRYWQVRPMMASLRSPIRSVPFLIKSAKHGEIMQATKKDKRPLLPVRTKLGDGPYFYRQVHFLIPNSRIGLLPPASARVEQSSSLHRDSSPGVDKENVCPTVGKSRTRGLSITHPIARFGILNTVARLIPPLCFLPPPISLSVLSPMSIV